MIVACANYNASVSEYIAAARRHHPGRPVVLISTTALNGQVAQAMGAGADDILTLPPRADLAMVQEMSKDVAFSVEKALARKRGVQAPSGQKLGRMICVLGLKGGSGKTLTAANLAVSLANAGHSVASIMAVRCPPAEWPQTYSRRAGAPKLEPLR